MIRIKDLKKLLNVVVHVITKTVKIKHAAIYLFDKEANNYAFHACRGKRKLVGDSAFIDSGSPLVWQLNFTKKPIVTEELVMRLRDEGQNQSMLKFVEQLKWLEGALVVPSFVEDRLIGILILGEKISGKLYSEDDLIVFSVLTNQAALAIENAQFYDEVKRTHEQLFQAEKMATIGTMADGLSHQINNRFHALSLISGDALDILKTYDGSNCSEETKQVLTDLKSALARIEANVLQGGEVVKGLLKYSRPGEGGYELVDLKDVLGGAIDMVQYKIKLKEIDLIQNIPLDLPKLYGNLTQLQEVFFNLIDNAYDATKERQTFLKEEGYKSRIEISASSVNGSIEIIVSDNGMGVKDLDRKKLFTPFFTTKATAKKGTGLGLYVIDKIVSAHNGKIIIDSIYKSGTRFTITLPISPKS
jgi:signal transduction histidine kinase